MWLLLHGARDQSRTELARIAFAPLTRGRELAWACSSMVEPAAHNGLVGGSNPSGPTNFPCSLDRASLGATASGSGAAW